MSVHDDFAQRGLLAQTTPGLNLDEPGRFYFGLDPTAPSLHLGNLIGLIATKRLLAAGHEPVIVVGDATGLIGDPSGRDKERPVQDPTVIVANRFAIVDQVRKIIPDLPTAVLRNSLWNKMSLPDFLSIVGKQLPLNQMLQKESVKRRLAGGITFAEFSYMAIQAYDFAWLNTNENVTMQIGGSDQWGNMSLGVDLVRRMNRAEAHALAWPLLVDAQGEKMGKTTGDKVWLDPTLTTPYEFFQFFMRLPDGDLPHLARLLSMQDLTVIESLCVPEGLPSLRSSLAFDMANVVHGEETAIEATMVSQFLFRSDPPVEWEMNLIAKHVPVQKTSDLVTALTEAGMATSRRDARELIATGAVTSTEIGDRLLVRKGKRHFMVVETT